MYIEVMYTIFDMEGTMPFVIVNNIENYLGTVDATLVMIDALFMRFSSHRFQCPPSLIDRSSPTCWHSYRPVLKVTNSRDAE
jgi:hypothetical protein